MVYLPLCKIKYMYTLFEFQEMIIVTLEPFKPEFTIVIFINYKPWIAVAILGL